MQRSMARDSILTALIASRYFKARECKSTIRVRVRIKDFNLRDMTQSMPQPVPERKRYLYWYVGMNRCNLYALFANQVLEK